MGICWCSGSVLEVICTNLDVFISVEHLGMGK